MNTTLEAHGANNLWRKHKDSEFVDREGKTNYQQHRLEFGSNGKRSGPYYSGTDPAAITLIVIYVQQGLI
uniref:Astacin domain-containing protein n=1 Tax=Steinernema glaseri TaxID=37863 RepID=A0A1I8AUQ7_9BILA